MFRVLSMGVKEGCEIGATIHSHGMWEFIYYTAGYGTMVCGSKEEPFRPNMLICIPPNMMHTELISEQISNIYLLINDDIGLEPRVYTYDDGLTREMEMIFTQLNQWFHKRTSNWENIIDALTVLTVELLKTGKNPHKTEYYVEQAVDRIIDNMHDSAFDIKKIYEGVPISKNYFAELFKRETGMTPTEYLITRRVEHAKQLLLQRGTMGYSVGDIAGLTGSARSFMEYSNPQK